uniref:Uncharacterized protein TCIL3000_11_7410 n=1 Tax=Trypanosoma congolense (strain IL3000) TaxID=1068625 RepID=G0V0Y7_TRYCI|nr:unnamed protein product [Trypanosoma congolense IL3000]
MSALGPESHPEAHEDNMSSPRPSAEVELRELREKTNLWKQSVAQQLSDAARKNKQLRDELKQANAAHESEMGALRVQLEKEFRERTLIKDEELESMQAQLGELRKKKCSMVEQHKVELEQLAARVRETCMMEHVMRSEAEAQQHEAQSQKLHDTIELKEKELAQSNHEVEVMKGRLERLAEQYRELSALMTSRTETPGDDGNIMDKEEVLENALKASVAAHQQQLETVRSEMHNLEGRHNAKLHEVERAHECERQRYMNEVYRREEQLATLQTLLRQAQHEAEAAHDRIHNVKLEKERVEQKLMERVEGLNRELASRAEQTQQLTAEVNTLQRELSRQEGLARSLEEEANMREEAFQSLLLSEENRTLVLGLQEALQKTRDEVENWRSKYEDAMREVNSFTVLPMDCSSRGSSDHEHMMQSLTQREKAVEEAESRLQVKAKLLRAEELRLEHLKRSMAVQASTILERRNSTCSRSASEKKDGERSDESRAFLGRPCSPLRYAQVMWNQRTSSGGSVLRYALMTPYSKARRPLMLIAFCMSIILIICVLKFF